MAGGLVVNVKGEGRAGGPRCGREGGGAVRGS